MGYIGSHGVAALHRYKYSGVDHSYVAKYVLQPFWTRFVHLFPLWMPPNMVNFCFLYFVVSSITLMGFMMLLLSALLGYIYSPQLDSAPPRWVNFAHGLLLFLYQTFDAVDGKQARRTNSSSPLGELFDHGCDALACTFEALAFGSTSMCGRSTFWWWLISAITFYGATWEHYFTNTLILPVVNGPTEGLMLIYLCHFFTAVVGAEWWAQQFGKSLPFLNWLPFLSDLPTYSAVLGLMIAFGVIPTVTFNVINVSKVVKSRKGSMPLALAMLYPFVVLVGGVLLWDYLSPSDIIANYPHLVVMGTGLTFGYLVGRMILSHLCDEPKGLKTGMCMSLLYLPLAIANVLASKLNDGVPLVNERLVLLGYCAFTASLYLHFATSVIHEITDALGIYCFRITRKEA
ncbi:choline/ethanolaminephosphotransferase [Trifolium repens]|nr:choline/ethanolaminephosphotransferase [Trifolium repens]